MFDPFKIGGKSSINFLPVHRYLKKYTETKTNYMENKNSYTENKILYTENKKRDAIMTSLNY